MNETMWAISRGEYSDYRVLAVCASEAVAKEQLARMGGIEYDAARLESIPLLTEVVDQVQVLRMSVTIWDDGTTSNDFTSMTETWPFDSWEPVVPVSWRWVRAPMHKGIGGRLDVRGTDHERVRRVLSDRRAELLATPSMAQRQEIKGCRGERQGEAMSDPAEYSEPVVTRHAGPPPQYTIDWTRKGYRASSVVADSLIDEWIADKNELERLRTIVRDLAELDPFDDEYFACVCCHAQGSWRLEPDGTGAPHADHAPSCPWLRAKEEQQ